MTGQHISEREFTDQVIAYARLCGWRTAHFRPARTKDGGWRTPVQGDGKGFPDLILVRPGEMIVAELKVGKGKPTPEQEAWLNAFRLAHVVAYLWTPDDWPVIEMRLAKP